MTPLRLAFLVCKGYLVMALDLMPHMMRWLLLLGWLLEVD